MDYNRRFLPHNTLPARLLQKALGNYSVLSGIAADSTCCIPFYRSGKGAAINFAHRQVSANSSCLGIRSRNNHSVGSQKHYFTAFCDLTIYVTYPAKQAQTITCHIDMAYRMSVSTEFSCVRSSWISMELSCTPLTSISFSKT